MKIRVEIDPEAPEEEIVLHCRELTPEVVKLQQLLAKQIKSAGQIILYQNDTEYYLETDRILFFETEGSQVLAHTETEGKSCMSWRICWDRIFCGSPSPRS